MRLALMLLGGCAFLAEVHDDIERTLDGRVVVGTALHLVDAEGLPTLEDLPAPGDSMLTIAVIDASTQSLGVATRVVAFDGQQEVELVEDTDNQVWTSDALGWEPGGRWEVEVHTPERDEPARITVPLHVVEDVTLPLQWPAGEDLEVTIPGEDVRLPAWVVADLDGDAAWTSLSTDPVELAIARTSPPVSTASLGVEHRPESGVSVVAFAPLRFTTPEDTEGANAIGSAIATGRVVVGLVEVP